MNNHHNLATGSLVLLVLGIGCSNENGAAPSGNGGSVVTLGGATATAGGAVGTGGATANATAPACTAPVTQKRHPGVYDYKSCNECHTDLLGGWVYSNAKADAWIPGATVTLTNSDNTTLVATSAVDGFFHLLDATMATTTAFTPCVSLCNDKTCATQPHTSLDCQSANCHGGANRAIYVTQTGVGGAPFTGTNCTPPASGGPRMHYPEFDDQTCVTCHPTNAGYIGGYVYDSVTGPNPVAMATVTITPNGGTPITAVTGPGGMFQFSAPFTAPYTACVSKCPNTVCSTAVSHPNTDDCATCHNSTTNLRIHVP
jgi:hypothetical protein